MARYRRLRLPGATCCFTLCLEERGSRLLTDNIQALRLAWHSTLQELPVRRQAVVVLPDHLHAIWTEPEGQSAYGERWRRIKARFSRQIATVHAPRASLQHKRERGIWQRRFWEHTIRNEEALHQALEYLRVNPVKHGLVQHPADWAYSSFNRPQQDGQ